MPAAAREISVWRLVPPLLIVMIATITFNSVEETDVYWHIRMGADILSRGGFGGDPSWVYGPGDASWVTTQWLSEVVLYLVYDAFGWTGVAVLRSLGGVVFLLSLMFVVRQVVPKSLGRDALARAQSVTMILAFAAGQFFVQERPQIVTFILLPWLGIMTLRLLYTGRWPRWWAAALMALVWAWFHGGALVMAPLLLLAFCVHRYFFHRKQGWVKALLPGLPVLAAVALAPALSPVGPAYYRQAYLIQEASKRYIYEWAPSDTDSIYFVVWAALIGVWVVAALRSKVSRRVLYAEATWLSILFAISITAFRYVPVAFLVAAPLVARRLAIAFRDSPPQKHMSRRAGIVIVGGVAAVLLGALASKFGAIAGSPQTDPNRIFASLAQSDGQRYVLVDYNMSGKTQMLTRDGIVVSIDGRSDRYGPWIDAYLDMFKGRPGWGATFDEYYAQSTDAIVEEDSAFIELLTGRGWTVNCADNGYVWMSAPGISASCVPPALNPEIAPAV